MNYIKQIQTFFLRNRVLQHISFWCVFFLLIITGDLIVYKFSIYKAFLLRACYLIPQILMAYYIAYLIIPGFFKKKKKVWYFVAFLLGTYLISALQRILVVHIAEPYLRAPGNPQESIREILTDLVTLLYYSISFFSVSLIFLFVKYFVNYIKIKEDGLKLAKEKAEAELQTLRTQLHPHFLFNTLNNIYILAIEKSSKTPESIAKLSEILDHILYKCNGTFVALSSEVELLRNYIALEKLRYDDRLIVNFTASIEKDIQIPPLILLSLTENAFKHGAGEGSGSPEIDIGIFQNEGVFTFKISNTISKDYQSSNPKAIGLSNIAKQLGLLYPGSYKFQTESKNDMFMVELEINQNLE